MHNHCNKKQKVKKRHIKNVNSLKTPSETWTTKCFCLKIQNEKANENMETCFCLKTQSEKAKEANATSL